MPALCLIFYQTPNMQQYPASDWSLSKTLTFRFKCILFLGYILLNPNGVLPFTDDNGGNWYLQPFHRLIPWLAQPFLHKQITIFTNGSGDTTYDYFVILFIVLLALIGCAIWSMLDRHRRSYPTLHYWLTVAVRYYLALTMLEYGMVKVIKLQFPFPYLGRLLQPYGNSSPMGLAWTFMGYSHGYNYFAGIAEVTAGILLFFRRTTTIGALLTLIVGAHIMAMNYCFDIPVKLLSTAIVLMAAWLLSDNAQQLFNLFFRGGEGRLTRIKAPIPKNRTWFLVGRTVKTLLVCYALVGFLIADVKAMRQYGDNAPSTALKGIYNIKTFIRNKDTLAPLQTDTLRWKQLVLDGSPTYGYASIRAMNDSAKGYFSFKPDTIQHTITLTSYADSTNKYAFHYHLPEKDCMVLLGAWKKDSLEIHLKLVDWKSFLLVRRGFHWINESPFNR
jgi:hypothetical protein